MQYRFFSIPVKYESDAEAELNEFLKSSRVITIHRELICQEGLYYWAIAIEYSDSDSKETNKTGALKKRIDYKEVLSPEDFAVFAKLRDWRKETAGREAVQLYTIFTNDQMAAMVEKKITTKNGLKEIDGIGDARVEKYANAVLEILKKEFQTENPELKNV